MPMLDQLIGSFAESAMRVAGQDHLIANFHPTKTGRSHAAICDHSAGHEPFYAQVLQRLMQFGLLKSIAVPLVKMDISLQWLISG